jgi:CheY-like chemotaxis protein
MFLDDSVARTNLFKQRSFGHSVKFADNARTAKIWLDQHDFDIIFLDHDLGEEFEGLECPEGTNDDGRTVSRYIVGLGDKHKETTIVIHSLNNWAAQEMYQILKDSGFEKVLVIPWAWKTYSLQEG